MKWKRARSAEQKEQRVSEIVDAAARLYGKFSFDEITITMIAKEAAFTRSNLYKYFPSKEEIFLEFLKYDIILWRKDLLRTFATRKSRSVKNFAAVWVEVLSKHKRLLDLLSIMSSYLEKNVAEQTLVNFKRSANDELKTVSDFLCGRFPGMDLEKAGRFIELQMASAIGLYQLTNLSDLQRKVLECPEFQHMKVDFNSFLLQSTEYLLKGLIT